jgi:succinoglycan biosynthesis protein ExoA
MSIQSQRAERVSVIATLLNERACVAPLLESLLLQSRQPDEIIIVDGGSTDGTIEALRSIEKAHSEIHVFVVPGANISQGRNYAIGKTTSPLIAATDGGCRQEPRWLEELVRPFSEETQIMAVGGFTAIDARSSFEKVSGMLVLPREPNAHAYANPPLSGRCSAFRKEAWKKAGGYPEWLYTGEDTLFAKKLRALGLRAVFAPKAVVSWRPRSSFRKLFKMFYLYGRGNARHGEFPDATLWHLKYYALELLLILLSFLWPILLLPLALIALYFFVSFYLPIISPVRASLTGMEAFFVAPAVIWTKTAGYTAGILVGAYEYHFVSPFRQNLEAYLGGLGKAI